VPGRVLWPPLFESTLSDFPDERGRGGKVSETRVERGAVASFGVLARGTNGAFHDPWKHVAQQTRLAFAIRGGSVYVTAQAAGR
jgi:hypothetical protein